MIMDENTNVLPIRLNMTLRIYLSLAFRMVLVSLSNVSYDSYICSMYIHNLVPYTVEILVVAIN